jgi:hypothetical protein
MLDKEKKFIILFDETKDRKVQIHVLDDIYKHSEALLKTLEKYS